MPPVHPLILVQQLKVQVDALLKNELPVRRRRLQRGDKRRCTFLVKDKYLEAPLNELLPVVKVGVTEYFYLL